MIGFALELRQDENGYWSEVPALPGCFACGRDLPELFEALAEAVQLYMAGENRLGEYLIG